MKRIAVIGLSLFPAGDLQAQRIIQTQGQKEWTPYVG